MVPYSKFPEYFRTYGRKEPLEPTHQPHGFGWGVPEKNFWDAVHGQRFIDFNVSMQTLDQMLPVIGIYPFEWIAQNAHHVALDAPLIVDVGGGKGQALAQIKRQIPEIPAERLVLQDREVTIEDAEASRPPELKGAKFMAHDFFKPQPVKGPYPSFLCFIIRKGQPAPPQVIKFIRILSAFIIFCARPTLFRFHKDTWLISNRGSGILLAPHHA